MAAHLKVRATHYDARSPAPEAQAPPRLIRAFAALHHRITRKNGPGQISNTFGR
jgi:hypothetical protein